MPAKRAIVIPQYQPVVASHDEQVKRLARASALLTKGEARRLQVQAAQSKVEISQEFIHDAPFVQRGTTIP